jgi:hypothetical protein
MIQVHSGDITSAKQHCRSAKQQVAVVTMIPQRQHVLLLQGMAEDGLLTWLLAAISSAAPSVQVRPAWVLKPHVF